MIREAKLLPVGPMARRLRVPVAWLRGEAEAGRVPHIQAGKVFLFNPDAVEAELVERASRTPTSVKEKRERPAPGLPAAGLQGRSDTLDQDCDDDARTTKLK